MKNTFIAAAFLAATLLAAQDAAAQTIGVKLGTALTDMRFNDATTTAGNIRTFAGGGHFRFEVMQRLGMQVEVLSVTKGADLAGTGSEGAADIRFEYVEVPVLLHLPLMVGRVAPYLVGGAAAGLEVRCRITGPGGEQACSDFRTFDRRSPDLLGVIGGGLSLPLGPGAALLEARYTAGLRNLNADANAALRDVRHRSTYLVAGYEVPLGSR
jgi:hypothetical protein